MFHLFISAHPLPLANTDLFTISVVLSLYLIVEIIQCIVFRLPFIFFMWMSSCSSMIYWKEYLCFIVLSSLWKVSWLYLCESVSTSSVVSIDWFVYSFVIPCNLHYYCSFIMFYKILLIFYLSIVDTQFSVQFI